YHRLGGNTDDWPVIPGEIKRKFQFTRQSFQTIPRLAPYRVDGLQILAHAGNMRFYRDTFVHGAFAGFDEANAALVFTPLDAKGQHYRGRVVRFSIPVLTQASLRAISTAADGAAFCQRLMKEFVFEHDGEN